ncbi:MAG: GNAT family N-acetyltransferase [Chloroflexi bacterium]|nr:GNAT family N-acetyltransferase [Chloroflexota bacterium]
MRADHTGVLSAATRQKTASKEGGAMTGDEVWIERAAESSARGWQLIAEAQHQRAATWDAAWLADPACPDRLPNAVTLRRPLHPAELPDLTASLDAFYAERPAAGPWMIWSVYPTVDLSDHGYVFVEEMPIMLRLPGGEPPPLPPELRIVEAHDASALAAIERALVEAFPVSGVAGTVPGCYLPPGLLGGAMRFWGGYVGEEVAAVAVAIMCEHHTDVFYIATQAAHRRRGYGAALTWTATLADPALPAVLEASDDGRPIYERMGFREVGRMSLWERPRDPAHPIYSPYCPPRP